MALRMVDATTGEVLWSGSASRSGFSVEEAADSAAQHVLNAVRSTWPPERSASGPP